MADERVERNKANWQRYQLELIVEHRLELLPELVAPEMTAHRCSRPQRVMTHEQFARDISKSYQPDDHSRTFEAIHGEGDFVWSRWTVNFTHTFTWAGVPATGKKIRHHEWAQVRFDADGRVVEGWFLADMMECYEMLGVTVTIEPPG